MSGPGKPHVYHPVSRYLLPTFLPNHPISESRKIIHVPAQVFPQIEVPQYPRFQYQYGKILVTSPLSETSSFPSTH